MDELGGLCFVPDDESNIGWQIVPLGKMKPGDVFRYIQGGCGPWDVLMDDAAPLQQRVAVLRGMLARGRTLRYHRKEPRKDGRPCCWAIEVDDDA